MPKATSIKPEEAQPLPVSVPPVLKIAVTEDFALNLISLHIDDKIFELPPGQANNLSTALRHSFLRILEWRKISRKALKHNRHGR